MKKNIVVISALFIYVSGFNQTVLGKLNFKPGQQIEISSTVKSTVTQEAMGQKIEFNIDGAVAQIYNVTSTANGNTILNHKPKRIYIKFEGMGQNQAFDSDKKEDLNSEMGKPLKSALEKSYEMTIDASGKVMAVKSTSANEKGAGSAGPDMMGNLLQQVGSSLDAPKEGSASFFKVLPDKPLAKGDSWSDSTIADSNKTYTTYTLSNVTDNEIMIDYKSNATTETKAETMGMEAVTKMNNVTTGKIVIDKATSIVKQKTSTTETSGTVEVAGQSIPLTSKSSTVINVK